MLSTNGCVAHENKVKDKMMTSSGLLILDVFHSDDGGWLAVWRFSYWCGLFMLWVHHWMSHGGDTPRYGYDMELEGRY